MDFTKLFQGKKTYTAAAVLVVFALLGASGVIEETTFLALAATAVSAIAAALRMAIAASQKESETTLQAAVDVYKTAMQVRGQVVELKESPPDPTLVQALKDTVNQAIIENLNASRVPDVYRRLGGSPLPMLLVILGLMVSTAAATPPIPVLRVIVNGEAYDLPDDESPIKVIAGDALSFDLSTSEGADRFFVMLDNRRPGQRELSTRDKWVHADLRTRSGDYNLRFIVSNAEATVELKRTVNVLCKEPSLPVEPIDPPQPQPSPKPTPGPIPTPPPLPPQPIPAGEFGIAQKVADIVRKIESPKRVTEAALLADQADALAAQIAAGTVTNSVEVLSRIGDGIRALNSPAWSTAAPQFTALMGEVWFANKVRLKIDEKKDMLQPTAWATLLREVALGARSAK